MATTEPQVQELGQDKGLKSGALGLISSTVIATASVAPAYSIAATLGFVVAGVGLQAPIVAILAFVPMILTSIGYSELNKADPDCGTTFTWATRAFGPGAGWAGGWAIVAADVLVMASLAQVAGQYIFLLFNANGIGDNPASGCVLLVGHCLDRGDDLHLLSRHRGLGQLPEGPAVHRDRHAAGAVGHRAGPGRHGHHPAVSLHPPAQLAEPVRPAVRRVRRRRHPDGVHLLGLGHRPVRSTRRPRTRPRRRAGRPSCPP